MSLDEEIVECCEEEWIKGINDQAEESADRVKKLSVYWSNYKADKARHGTMNIRHFYNRTTDTYSYLVDTTPIQDAIDKATGVKK